MRTQSQAFLRSALYQTSLHAFILCVYHSPSWQGSESAYSKAYKPKELRKIKYNLKTIGRNILVLQVQKHKNKS